MIHDVLRKLSSDLAFDALGSLQDKIEEKIYHKEYLTGYWSAVCELLNFPPDSDFHRAGFRKIFSAEDNLSPAKKAQLGFSNPIRNLI